MLAACIINEEKQRCDFALIVALAVLLLLCACAHVSLGVFKTSFLDSKVPHIRVHYSVAVPDLCRF